MKKMRNTASSKSKPKYKFGYNVFFITQNVKDYCKSVLNKKNSKIYLLKKADSPFLLAFAPPLSSEKQLPDSEELQTTVEFGSSRSSLGEGEISLKLDTMLEKELASVCKSELVPNLFKVLYGDSKLRQSS